MLAQDSMSNGSQATQRKKKPKQKSGNAERNTGIAGGAVSGAVTGSSFGPIGTVIGGVAGAVMGAQGSKAPEDPNRPEHRRLTEFSNAVRTNEQRRASALAALSQSASDFAFRLR